LPAVWATINGRVTALRGDTEKVPTRYKAGEGLLAGGSILLILSVLAALANILLNSGASNYGVILNLLIGLIVTVPMITIGTVRLRRARRHLQQKDERSQLASDESQPRHALTESADPTGHLLSSQTVK
jgi:hypothetical protein